MSATYLGRRICDQHDHKYEPGPWRVCRRCGGESPVLRLIKDGNSRLLYEPEAPLSPDKETTDLLKATEALFQIMDSDIHPTRKDGEFWAQMAVVEKASLALRKALHERGGL
jgi:hypothetical protein